MGRPNTRNIYQAPSRSVTYFVAAGNAQENSYRQADARCNGNGDEGTINPIIAQASSTGGTVVLSEGSFNLASTITMAANVKLNLLRGASLLPQGDFNVVTMTPDASLEGGEINTSGVSGFSNAAIYFDGADKYGGAYNTSIKDIKLQGTEGEGIGIHLYSNSGQTNNVSLVRFLDITINNFDIGLKLEAVLPSAGNAFVNGNHFIGIHIHHCTRQIEITAGGRASTYYVAGNIFVDVSTQVISTTDYAIYCDGGNSNNFINIAPFDLANGTQYEMVFFSNTTYGNWYFGRGSKRYLIDKGRSNHIQSTEGFSNVIKTGIPPSGVYLPSFSGLADDHLVLANEIHTVTSSGATPTAGSTDNLFTVGKNTTIAYNSDIDTDPVIITITFAATVTLFAAGIIFNFGRTAAAVKIEYYTGSDWVTIIDMTGNNNEMVVGHAADTSATFYVKNADKIRYTIKTTVHADNTVKIERLFAFVTNKDSVTYLPGSGGQLWGVVDYKWTMANSSKDPTTDAPADWVQIKIGGTTYYVPAYAAS